MHHIKKYLKTNPITKRKGFPWLTLEGLACDELVSTVVSTCESLAHGGRIPFPSWLGVGTESETGWGAIIYFKDTPISPAV